MALEVLSLPDSLTWLGQRAFKDCKALKTIALPPQLDYLEEGSFEGCSSLDAVLVGENLSHIESRAFASTGLQIDDISLPDNCSIAEDAFA